MNSHEGIQHFVIRTTYVVIDPILCQFCVVDLKILRKYSDSEKTEFTYVNLTDYIDNEIFDDIVIKAHEYGEELCDEIVRRDITTISGVI